MVLGDVAHDGVDQVAAKALAKEVVEERIGDAVEKRETLHHNEGEVEDFHYVAAEHEGVKIVNDHQQHDQVVGQPADDKHQRIHVDQPDVPPALHVRGGPDRPGDQDVAGDDDGCRAEELEDRTEEGNGDEPLGEVVLRQHVATRFVPL